VVNHATDGGLYALSVMEDAVKEECVSDECKNALAALDEDKHLIPLPASYFELENVHQQLAAKEDMCVSVGDVNNNPYRNGEAISGWNEMCASETTTTYADMAVIRNNVAELRISSSHQSYHLGQIGIQLLDNNLQ